MDGGAGVIIAVLFVFCFPLVICFRVNLFHLKTSNHKLMRSLCIYFSSARQYLKFCFNHVHFGLSSFCISYSFVFITVLLHLLEQTEKSGALKHNAKRYV